MVFAGEGHPNQTALSRSQQQQPDRAVDDAVREVENAVTLGRGHQPGVNLREVVDPDVNTLHQIADDVSSAAHRDVPFFTAPSE